MSRRQIDTLTQAALVDEVRLAIDAVCDECLNAEFACGRARCFSARLTVRRLARENPHSMWSTKVLYNIGVRRLTRVLYVVKPPVAARARARAALPSRYVGLVPDFDEVGVRPSFWQSDMVPPRG
jgi:hypothetical protein